MLERLKPSGGGVVQQHQRPPINLTNADLPRIVNGKPGDMGKKKKPFSHVFRKASVAKSWDSVGAVGKGGFVRATWDEATEIINLLRVGS